MKQLNIFVERNKFYHSRKTLQNTASIRWSCLH